MHRFAGGLVRPAGVGTWTYVNVPLDVPALFGTRGQVPVRGTVNGIPLLGSLRPHGDGGFYLVINQELRAQAGVSPGETVMVEVERDDDPRQVAVPADLQTALQAHALAAAAFGRMSYTHQREYVNWLAAAKKPETRARRLEKALVMLAAGQPRR